MQRVNLEDVKGACDQIPVITIRQPGLERFESVESTPRGQEVLSDRTKAD